MSAPAHQTAAGFANGILRDIEDIEAVRAHVCYGRATAFARLNYRAVWINVKAKQYLSYFPHILRRTAQSWDKVLPKDDLMCGIAGIIGRLTRPNRAALQRMNEPCSSRPGRCRHLGLDAR